MEPCVVWEFPSRPVGDSDCCDVIIKKPCVVGAQPTGNYANQIGRDRHGDSPIRLSFFTRGVARLRAACGATGYTTRAWWRVQPRLLTQKRDQFLQPTLINGSLACVPCAGVIWQNCDFLICHEAIWDQIFVFTGQNPINHKIMKMCLIGVSKLPWCPFY